ncbi:MAG: hypothetical protein HY952_08380 [Elusimicrobia bacterium]|nr:hypothetical protein [Elusimicrobiota bacterium]
MGKDSIFSGLGQGKPGRDTASPAGGAAPEGAALGKKVSELREKVVLLEASVAALKTVPPGMDQNELADMLSGFQKRILKQGAEQAELKRELAELKREQTGWRGAAERVDELCRRVDAFFSDLRAGSEAACGLAAGQAQETRERLESFAGEICGLRGELELLLKKHRTALSDLALVRASQAELSSQYRELAAGAASGERKTERLLAGWERKLAGLLEAQKISRSEAEKGARTASAAAAGQLADVSQRVDLLDRECRVVLKGRLSILESRCGRVETLADRLADAARPPGGGRENWKERA